MKPNQANAASIPVGEASSFGFEMFEETLKDTRGFNNPAYLLKSTSVKRV